MEERPDIFSANPWRFAPRPGFKRGDIAASGIHEDKTKVGVILAAAVIDRV